MSFDAVQPELPVTNRPSKKPRINDCTDFSGSSGKDIVACVKMPFGPADSRPDFIILALTLSYISKIAASQNGRAIICQRLSELQLPHRLKSLYKLDVQEVLLLVATVWQAGRVINADFGFGWIRRLPLDYSYDHKSHILEPDPSNFGSHEYPEHQRQNIVGDCERAVVVLSFIINGSETACAVTQLKWQGCTISARVYRARLFEDQEKENALIDAVKAAAKCACYQWAANTRRYQPRSTSTICKVYDFPMADLSGGYMKSIKDSSVHCNTILTAWALLQSLRPNSELRSQGSKHADEAFVWVATEFFGLAIQGRLNGVMLSSFLRRVRYVETYLDLVLLVPGTVMMNQDILMTLMFELLANPGAVESDYRSRDVSTFGKANASQETTSQESLLHEPSLHEPTLPESYLQKGTPEKHPEEVQATVARPHRTVYASTSPPTLGDYKIPADLLKTMSDKYWVMKKHLEKAQARRKASNPKDLAVEDPSEFEEGSVMSNFHVSASIMSVRVGSCETGYKVAMSTVLPHTLGRLVLGRRQERLLIPLCGYGDTFLESKANTSGTETGHWVLVVADLVRQGSNDGTADEVNLTLFDSSERATRNGAVFRKARDVVQNCGWLAVDDCDIPVKYPVVVLNKVVRQVPQQLQQAQGADLSGIYVVLNAWAMILGVPIIEELERNMAVAGTMNAKLFSRHVTRLVNFTWRGRVPSTALLNFFLASGYTTPDHRQKPPQVPRFRSAGWRVVDEFVRGAIKMEYPKNMEAAQW